MMYKGFISQRPVKIRHVGTLLQNRKYLSIGIKNCLHSVTCIIKPIDCRIPAQSLNVMA